jgi:transcriptional regulator with XRE-family HTH domain
MGKRRDGRHLEACKRLQIEFGRRLKAARVERGEMQKQLGGRMGLSRTSVSNLERGKQRIYLDQLFQASHLLGFPLDQLLPPVEKVFPKHAFRTATDDPLSSKAEEEASRVIRTVTSKGIRQITSQSASLKKPFRR